MRSLEIGRLSLAAALFGAGGFARRVWQTPISPARASTPRSSCGEALILASPQPVQATTRIRVNRGALAATRKALGRVRPTREVIVEHKVHAVVHALRLWGRDHVPAGIDEFSGRQLLGILLDDRAYRSTLAPSERQCLIYDSDYGIAVWTQSDTLAEPHTDKILSVCGELGVPLSTAVRTRTGSATVLAMLADSVSRFNPGQSEVNWSAIAYASYLSSWAALRNRFDKPFDLSDIVLRIASTRPGDGTCFGTHVLYSLAFVLQCDERKGLLRERAREAARNKLEWAVGCLRRSQYSTGLWALDWFLPAPPRRSETAHPELAMKNLLRATGHHLEWMLIAPQGLAVPLTVMERAFHGIIRGMIRMHPMEVMEGYNPLTHASRALCLALDRTPDQIMRGDEDE